MGYITKKKRDMIIPELQRAKTVTIGLNDCVRRRTFYVYTCTRVYGRPFVHKLLSLCHV